MFFMWYKDFEITVKKDFNTVCLKNDTVKFDNFYLYFNANQFWECKETTCAVNFNIIKSCYANIFTYIPEGEIKSIDIYSDADYDSLHPAGTSLNDIFIIYSRNQVPNIKKIISETQFPIITYEWFSLSIDNNFSPDSLRLHQFTVIYKEVDGTTITKKFPAIYIMPNTEFKF